MQPHIRNLRPTPETLEFPNPGRAMVRKWVGETDDGIEVDVYVAAVRVTAEDTPAFLKGLGKELEELSLTTPGYRDPRRPTAIDARLVT